MNLFGLVGYPLEHSFSKNYFNNKFENENILNCTYENFPINNINEFEKLINNNKNLVGLNITVPYKESVLNYVNQQDEIVQKCGATNCLKISNEIIAAYNTDVIGFEKSLIKIITKEHKKALIIGTGGASKAVAFVLNKLKINYKYISRNTKNLNTISYKELNKSIIEEHTLIINVSPIGMFPNENNFPNIPYEFITPNHFCYDLIYNPEETIFLKNAKLKGATIKNGFEMLVLQAEAAWKIWNE